VGKRGKFQHQEKDRSKRRGKNGTEGAIVAAWGGKKKNAVTRYPEKLKEAMTTHHL